MPFEFFHFLLFVLYKKKKDCQGLDQEQAGSQKHKLKPMPVPVASCLGPHHGGEHTHLPRRRKDWVGTGQGGRLHTWALPHTKEVTQEISSNVGKPQSGCCFTPALHIPDNNRSGGLSSPEIWKREDSEKCRSAYPVDTLQNHHSPLKKFFSFWEFGWESTWALWNRKKSTTS